MKNSDIGLISIVIPVYNIKQYVKKCVESVKRQTYGNIEIIIVDDGSTDGSSGICDSLIGDNVKVFHKQNGGLSSARNYGIKKATGRYIGFVDGDDYIGKDMFQILANAIEEYSADVSACGYTMVDGKKLRAVSRGKETKIFNREESLKNMFDEMGFGIIACNKLFKKDLFDGVVFPEGRQFEDINTMYKIFSKINCLVYVPEQYYFYVRRLGSINNVNFDSLAYNERNDDLFFASMEVYNFIKKNHPSIIKWVSSGCVVFNLRVLNQRILFYKDVDSIASKTKQIIKENGGFEFYSMLSVKRRFEIRLFYYCPRFYYFLIRIIKRKVEK